MIPGVVPEEYVTEEQFAGDLCEVDYFNKVRSTGKRLNIVVTIAGRYFHRETVTQPGQDLAWTVCLSIPYSNKEEREFVSGQMDAKFALQEEETCCLPAEMENSILRSGIMVSDGTLIADADMGGAIPEPQNEEGQCSQNSVQTAQQAEVLEMRESDGMALETVIPPSVVVEEGGDQVGGSAVGEGEQGVSLEGITQ